MKKSSFVSLFREYAKTLSPQARERALVENIYESFTAILGGKCIQIGSYPRFTSITPVHDLDILYIIGPWEENNHSPDASLQSLFSLLKATYRNPTIYKEEIGMQTHSVTIDFKSGLNVIFSVDIVPAYIFGKNEFLQDTYRVPEVLKEKKHQVRRNLSWDPNNSDAWIKSDPLGYIEVAKRVGTNDDFRKTVKIVKRWKLYLEQADSTLTLKSFHVEQIVTKLFRNNPTLNIFDAIFMFFIELPLNIKTPKILDRANPHKYIDDYLSGLTIQQINKIIKARDGFLVKLENHQAINSIESLMSILFYERHGVEEFLFDQGIPTFTVASSDLEIQGELQFRQGSYLKTILAKTGIIDIDRQIKFVIKKSPEGVDLYKWKVKNANNSSQPRGEITDHHTKNTIENTKYVGSHFVECYAIKDNQCIAKAHQDVVLLK